MSDKDLCRFQDKNCVLEYGTSKCIFSPWCKQIKSLQARVAELDGYFKHPEKYPKCPNCGLGGDLEGHTCIAQAGGKE